MTYSRHDAMTVQEVRENLPDLVKLIAQGKKRVEVLGTAGESCVLISKAELESLEQAISILADSDEFRALSNSLNQVAAATTLQPAVA